MRAQREVLDADWAALEPLLRFPQRADGRGCTGSAGWLFATNFHAENFLGMVRLAA